MCGQQNIDDDALHTHRYRAIDVKAGSQNLDQSIMRIIIDTVLLELSFNCSKKMHSTVELRIQPLLSQLNPKAAQPLCGSGTALLMPKSGNAGIWTKHQ